MKRFLSMVLTVFLLACVASFAYAGPEPLRVLAGDSQTAEEYQKTYPERAVQIINVDYMQGYRGNLVELVTTGDWDVAFIGTQEFDLAALAEAGLAMELSTIPEITALADNLYPSIRAAVTVDGTLAALPANYVASNVMGLRLMSASTSFSDVSQQRIAVHLEALGFTADDQPKTFRNCVRWANATCGNHRTYARGLLSLRCKGTQRNMC